MVTALCHSLQDNLVLTQRASLDVLIFCCPLSNLPVLYTDACMLLEAALQCLLRRDMSLNRRLYSWLLGMDQSKQSSVSSLESTETPTYFENHSKQLLVESLQHMLDTQTEKMPRLHYTSIIEELFPLRILVSLLDKSEVGPVVIESVLLQVFRLLEAAVNRIKSTFQQPHDNEKKNSLIGEVCKTANLLLGVFEPGYIWKFLSKILFSNYPGCKEKQGGSSLSESCRF
uniref:Uncharacterized protein n=1 Tax=Ciona savignyi TaxID=51511 RepID=H2Z8K7_CIOSA